MAVVNRPANSITGRYQAEIFTERMWASNSRWLPVLEALRLDVLAAEGLDDPDAGDALLELRQRVADAVAHVEVGLVRVALELDARQHDERHADQAEQEQLPRHDAEHEHATRPAGARCSRT